MFLLITGYFMCRQEFKWRKVVGLYCLVKFYRLTIYAIFLLSGYEQFSLRKLYKTLFNVAFGFGKGFTSSFIGLYFLVPFINRFLSVIDEKDFERLLLTLLVLFTGVSSFFLNGSFEYTGWYVTVYMVGAYIRQYPFEILKNRKLMAVSAAVLIFLSWASAAFIYFVSVRIRMQLPYYWFVTDSNKILAFLTATALFCLFRQMKLGKNKFINTLSACTFPVLLIHASSDTMRRWLWQDVCGNTSAFSEWWFPLHALLSTVSVYAVCVCIELARKMSARILAVTINRIRGNKK